MPGFTATPDQVALAIAKNEIETLRARVAELEKDKARLDWLDDTSYEGEARLTMIERLWWTGGEGTVRQEIDAAMQKGEE